MADLHIGVTCDRGQAQHRAQLVPEFGSVTFRGFGNPLEAESILAVVAARDDGPRVPQAALDFLPERERERES